MLVRVALLCALVALAATAVVSANELSATDACTQIAGSCRLKSQGCNGVFRSGFCPGASVCCVASSGSSSSSTPAPAAASDRCGQIGGSCKTKSLGCNGQFKSGYCPGATVCCVPAGGSAVPSNSLQPQPSTPTASTSRTSILRGATLFKGVTQSYKPEIAGQPQAMWLTGGRSRVYSWGANEVGVVVLYNIPGRDGGSFSAGGAGGGQEYLTWVQMVASSIGYAKTAVILEPDGLVQSAPGQRLSYMYKDRIAVLKQAIAILRKNPNTAVYVDIGHAEWLSCQTAASVLRALGPSTFEGFSINVSNFVPTASSIQYGKCVSQAAGGNLHFVIDTSRNGGGRRNSGWCNPAEAGLGQNPNTNTGDNLLDALLWIKRPGESDGNCCSYCPNAGQYSDQIAASLISHSGGR